MARSVAVIFSAIILALNYPVYAQTDREKFPPMVSSVELGLSDGKAALNILSEVVFADRFVDDSTWSKMTEKEKKGGYVNIYYYKYTFINTGTVKIKFAFGNYEILRSPLFQFIQDFSIVLERGQKRTVHFTANTEPKIVDVTCRIMIWLPEKNRWFSMGGFGTSIYTPQWNAIAEETPY